MFTLSVGYSTIVIAIQCKHALDRDPFKWSHVTQSVTLVDSNFNIFLYSFLQGLTVPSPTEQEVRIHKAILLDVTVDAPACAMWLCMKQFNGYFGCGKCKEPGKQLMIGVGKKNVQVHILPHISFL